MRRRSAIGSAARTSSPSIVMLAGVGVDQPVRQPQQRGLAGAGAADDGEEFALGDVERDVVHGLDPLAPRPPSKLFADMRKGDQGRGLAFSRPTDSHFPSRGG